MSQNISLVPTFTDSSVASPQPLPFREPDAISKKRASPSYPTTITTVDQGARCSRRRKSFHSKQPNTTNSAGSRYDDVNFLPSYIQVSPPIEFRVVEEAFQNYDSSSTNVEPRPRQQAWLQTPTMNRQSRASLSKRRTTGIVPTVPDRNAAPTKLIPTLSSRRPTAMQKSVRRSVGGQRGGSQLSPSLRMASAVEAQADIQFSFNGNNRKSFLQKTAVQEKINRRNTNFPPSHAQESSQQMLSSRKFDGGNDNPFQTSHSVHANTQPSTQLFLNWNAPSEQMNVPELRGQIRIPRRNTGMPPPGHSMQLRPQQQYPRGNMGNTLQPSQAVPSFVESGPQHLSIDRVQRKNTSVMSRKPALLNEHGLRNEQQQQQHHLVLPASFNTRSQPLQAEQCCVADCNAISLERGFCFAHGQRVRGISISKQ